MRYTWSTDNGNFIPIGHPSFHSLDPCFYSTKVLVRNRHCTWTTHFRRSTNKLTRWVSRTGTMNFNHEVRSLPGTTATRLFKVGFIVSMELIVSQFTVKFIVNQLVQENVILVDKLLKFTFGNTGT